MSGSTGTPVYPGSRAGSYASPAPGSMYGGSRTSPAHGSLHGSRGSLNQGINEEPDPIDPSLINPADTVPQDMPPNPGEDVAFTLPGYQGPVNEKTKEGKGGIKGKLMGKFGKVKGMLKKDSKSATGASNGIEDYDDDMGSQDDLDRMETPGAPGTDSDKQSTMQKFQNFFKKDPEMARPSVYQPGDIMKLKEPPPKSKITFGNFINVMLIVYMVAGFIMCCCIGVEPALYYLGPAFLGLAFFALIGKCFFSMLFADEDPTPEAIKPMLATLDKYLGGVKDPYAHKKYGTHQPKPVATYYGPMSGTSQDNVMQMETFGAAAPPALGQPKMYDESIDTRLRVPSPQPSNNPSYSSRQQSPVPFSSTNQYAAPSTNQFAYPNSANRSADRYSSNGNGEPLPYSPNGSGASSSHNRSTERLPYSQYPNTNPAPYANVSHNRSGDMKTPSVWK